MKIEITQEHIKEGNECSARWCPGALAINDALGLDGHDAYSVVGECDINVCIVKNRDQESHSMIMLPVGPTPEVLRKFIARFDDHKRVDPCAFKIPDEDLDLISNLRSKSNEGQA